MKKAFFPIFCFSVLLMTSSLLQAEENVMTPEKIVGMIITEYVVVDRITDHLKLRFVADKPPPSHVFEQAALAAVEESGNIFEEDFLSRHVL